MTKLQNNASKIKYSLVSIGVWYRRVDVPCASHVSFWLWLLLHICLSLLVGYSDQTYLDGLSHTSSTEMRYLCFYSVGKKVSRKMLSGY